MILRVYFFNGDFVLTMPIKQKQQCHRVLNVAQFVYIPKPHQAHPCDRTTKTSGFLAFFGSA